MEIILHPRCESLTGTLGAHTGYAIQKQKGHFVSKRNSKGAVPPDGHWRFIRHCAKLTTYHIYASDIILPANELIEALEQANICYAPLNLKAKPFYNAKDILNFPWD